MNRSTLPRALFAILVAVAAAAQPAVALPSSSPLPPGAEPVDDATLAGVSGRYYGANMLVGLRVDLVSTLRNADGTTATASGTLSMQRNGSGFTVQVGSQAGAHSGGAAGPSAMHRVYGGEAVQVQGITQVVQIAGDGNRMANVTTIAFVPVTGPATDLNGQASSHATSGPVTARITFENGGAHLALTAPGALLTQRFGGGAGDATGRIAQLGQLAGQQFSASNEMHLQLSMQAMTMQMQRQLGILQALSGLSQLNR